MISQNLRARLASESHDSYESFYIKTIHDDSNETSYRIDQWRARSAEAAVRWVDVSFAVILYNYRHMFGTYVCPNLMILVNWIKYNLLVHTFLNCLHFRP